MVSKKSVAVPAEPIYEVESSESEAETQQVPKPTKSKCSPELYARLAKARAAKKQLHEPNSKAKELEKKRRELKHAASEARVKELEQEVARLQVATIPKKPKKQKKVIVEESSSSEEEVVVRRRRRAPSTHVSASQPAPQQAPPELDYDPRFFGRYG